MPRNQPRYHSGRSAVARRAIISGNTNGMMPHVNVMLESGEIIRTTYFGGDKKGGAQPSATGFMIPSGRRNLIATPAARPNFLFRFKTGPGPSPFGFGPYA